MGKDDGNARPSAKGHTPPVLGAKIITASGRGSNGFILIWKKGVSPGGGGVVVVQGG